MKTWNYLKDESFAFAKQSDWNQTLISKLNQISSQDNMNSPVKIIAPYIMKSLFESLAYFEENKIMGHLFKYEIIFTEIKSDVIKIGNNELQILNYKL